jgi:hypothetical protein
MLLDDEAAPPLANSGLGSVIDARPVVKASKLSSLLTGTLLAKVSAPESASGPQIE